MDFLFKYGDQFRTVAIELDPDSLARTLPGRRQDLELRLGFAAGPLVHAGLGDPGVYSLERSIACLRPICSAMEGPPNCLPEFHVLRRPSMGNAEARSIRRRQYDQCVRVNRRALCSKTQT
jgi:hypothetical protein